MPLVNIHFCVSINLIFSSSKRLRYFRKVNRHIVIFTNLLFFINPPVTPKKFYIYFRLLRSLIYMPLHFAQLDCIGA